MSFSRTRSRFGAFLAQRHTPPFRHFLPSNVDQLLAGESRWERFSANFKLLKRWAWLRFKLPAHRVHDHLPKPSARLLWLNCSMPCIGDSIMDLSGRALLENYEIDLLTGSGNAGLYSSDLFFKNVFSKPDEINAGNYDWVILDQFNTQSIRLTSRLCGKLPITCMQHFFYGPRFNRILFSGYRIHHLLGYPHTDEELRPFLRPRLFLQNTPSPLPPRKKTLRCALVLGGVSPIRTYGAWDAVIKCLRANEPSLAEQLEFALLGSENARRFENPVTAALNGWETHSQIARLTLRQTARAIADCDFFLGVDGGLMHCAEAQDVPGLALFATVLPELRFGPHSKMKTIFDPKNVNNLPPQKIAESLLACLNELTVDFSLPRR